MGSRRDPGFTLIELLIVVAIIGILAAIAIPNFLQAQTRAKVSRTIADMRTVAVAFEEYNVDWNQYPVLGEGGLYVGYLMVIPGWTEYVGRQLTSPSDYMSRIPMDYFNTARFRGGPDFIEDTQYSYWVNIQTPGNDDDEFQNWIDEMRAVIPWWPPHVDWMMESCGPNLEWWAERGRDPSRYIYDPTNGTISDGMIALSNKVWISPHIQ